MNVWPSPPPPPPHGRLRERVMSTRTLAAALAPGLLLALASWAGEAAAQNVCRGGSHTGSGIITCIEGAGSSADILVDPGSLGITSPTVNAAAVEGNHSGSGDVELRMTAGSIVTTGTAGHGLYARHVGATGGGAIVIGMSGGSIETRGSNAYAIRGRRASGTGNVRIDVTGGSLSRTGGTGGVVLGAHGGTGDVTVTMTAGATLEATGAGVRGLSGSHSGTGDLTVSLTGGSVVTTSNGVGATRSNAATAGNVAVTVSHASSVVRTTGNNGHGLAASNSGSGDATVTMRDGLVETTGGGSRGISAYSSYTGMNPGTVSVVMEGGAVRTSGGTYATVLHAHGIYAESNNGHVAVSVRMTGGAVETAGASANGIVVFKAGPAGAGSIEMTGGSVTTAGDGAHGAYVYMYDTGASTEGLSIDAAGAVSAEGLNARGLLGVHTVLGSAAVRTRAAAEVAAPFAVGMEGRLTNDASAAGRIVVTHEGAVEARDVGVLAWAARSSGHTMGAGATTANDAARTTPMIHVTSSGTVTVGSTVTDAFIRRRITGADGTLSAGEQAVLSAITAGDSGALTTALAALPAAYDAAWKAEAQDLLRKRAASSAAPTGDGPLAHRAAEEILGLTRAGVRAVAISHTAIADYVRGSDALSTAERTVLEAVLTGDSGGLTTALNGLPAAYTTAWKNTVQRLAATYNAGDVRVDVTGGPITAEGNGVEALYAVPHDDNGAITVTVAEGARVTGGANGVHVRGAGANSPRAQSVIVNGRVTGGTGAGVRLTGGGRLTVGPKGRVGASSGVGVLADGAGDLTATISGTVEGDVRTGNGELVVVIRDAGGAPGRVTGRIEEVGGVPEVRYQPSGATRAVRVTEAFGTKGATPAGAFDVGIVAEDGGAVRVESGHAPRARVYEALPSVLLGLNRLPEFRDRMSAPRSAGGAGWARVEASRDEWRAAESASASRLEYTHRRYGLSAGADFAMDERTLLGGSVHHRQGKAKVKGGGELDVSGRGVGVSGVWGLAGSGDAMAYVDAQAEATWYEADFRSSLRGGLKTDVSGRGHALGVEVGRRYEAGGMALTSRARLAHSKVSMEDFTDSVGARVSLEDGRSLRGGAGVAWEMNPGGASGSRVFGSLDVEREFSPETKTVVSKTDLKAEAGATWVRLGLSGSHAWGDDGRYSVEGGVSYATNGGGHELGGGVSLNVRF